MRVISRKFHAVMDYLMGVLLIVSPWLFGFADIDGAKWSVVIVGIMMLLMSFITDYEGGGRKLLSMSTHLTMDIIAGLFLVVSPWLFNFDEQVYLPHVIFGLLEIGAGLMTQTDSQHSGTHHIDRGISPAH